MDLLVINPNTTEAITQCVHEVVRAMAPAGVSVRAVTAAFGPRYIASRSTFAVASHGALDAYARHGDGADAVLLACFGDPGLDAIRELSPAPVIGLVEAAAHEAAAHGRFAIVTGGVLWEPMLREMHATRGLDQSLAAIRTVAPSGAAIAADPDGSLALLADACRRAIHEDGAQAVILGGAGLVGLAARVQPLVGAPVICSVEAGVRAALRALEQRPDPAGRKPGPIDSVDLSPDLARLLNAATG
ncbi:MAG: aspartate/glutamate racemase family protein [Beijerinckiaceae bacterium]|nr:aspartate/glutamate racemase family protein [Beijerinckiaceae bacterium]